MGEPVKDAPQRAAEVLRKYASEIEDSEINHSGPMKGKCDPEIQKELDEYRSVAAALETDGWIPVGEKLPDDDITVMVAVSGWDEPVWFGWHDDEGWLSATDGASITKMVTHWKPMPEGPA